jgi:hypothetical protein
MAVKKGHVHVRAMVADVALHRRRQRSLQELSAQIEISFKSGNAVSHYRYCEFNRIEERGERREERGERQKEKWTEGDEFQTYQSEQ